MSETQPKTPPVLALRAAIEQARDTAGDQLAAAWQLQIARAQEQLSAGWHENLETVVRERFEEISARLEEDFQRAVNERVVSSVEAAVTLARDLARRELAEVLNRHLRHLRQAESTAEYVAALLGAAGEFCERALLFSATSHHFRFQGARPADEAVVSALEGKDFYLRDAAALQSAVESRDTVVAMKRPGELGEAVAQALREGAAEGGKVYIFPVAARLNDAVPKVVALLVAEGDDSPVDVNALELLGALAGSAFETRHAAARAAAGAATGATLVSISTPPAKPGPTTDWSALPRAEQDAHLRAQRFARVQVAEMRLYKSEKVKQGRVERNLYGCLSEEIDRSREAFRQQYLEGMPSMVDYLHLEIVKTLANDDVSLLGPGYPGPLG